MVICRLIPADEGMDTIAVNVKLIFLFVADLQFRITGRRVRHSFK
jgi:hypothetical protein